MFTSVIIIGCALASLDLSTVVAQSSDDFLIVSSGSFPSTTRDSPSSATATFAVPSVAASGEPCAQINSILEKSDKIGLPAVSAELAYDCLISVPIDRQDALDTVDTVIKMAQFQSNLANMKDPPEGYPNAAVDILGGLDELRNLVATKDFSSQYEFEKEIALLLNRGRDGHLGFDGPTYAGAVRWRRDPNMILVSASLDGGSAKIYTYVDLTTTNDPSPVTQINGKDVITFLEKEADLVPAHDADARWNNLFYRPAGQVFGYFISPALYPGPTTALTYENGTEQVSTNAATILEPSRWFPISDGSSFYSELVAGRPRMNKRDVLTKAPPAVPKRLRQLHEVPDDSTAEVLLGYPEPFLTGPSEVYLNGYFIDHPIDANLAVLSIQTFLTDTDRDSQRYQSLIEDFLTETKSRGTKKVIIDVQSNPGGKVFLGYDAFLQFFPNIYPFGGARMRGHEGADILGTQLSSLSFSQSGFGYTSPFNYHSFTSSNNQDFKSWADLSSGPTSPTFNYSKVLRYDLTDANIISSTTYGDGITLTGFGSRSNFSTPPFNASDIVLLTDGICGSTCFLFAEFLTLQAGVKAITVGGRPDHRGPMQFVGATKGSNVLSAEYLTIFSQYLISEFASSTTERRRWAEVLPVADFPIQVIDASVNFLDSVREGDGPGAAPTQFANESGNCRLWYERAMVTDVTTLWAAVADAAWGGEGGGFDRGKCVPGSFREESLLEKPPSLLGVPGGRRARDGSGEGEKKKGGGRRLEGLGLDHLVGLVALLVGLLALI